MLWEPTLPINVPSIHPEGIINHKAQRIQLLIDKIPHSILDSSSICVSMYSDIVRLLCGWLAEVLSLTYRFIVLTEVPQISVSSPAVRRTK
jgi:hypothetical protein